MPRKKATFKITDDIADQAENHKDHGGKAPATLAKRKSVDSRFSFFLMEYKGITIDQLVANALESKDGRTEMESILMAFFTSMKIADEVDENGDELPPMKNTIESYKSNLRMIFLEKSDGQIDIMNPIMFKRYLVIFFFFFSYILRFYRS